MLLKYARYYEIKIYKKLIMVNGVPKESIETKLVTCDAWYLFGKFLLYQRINING